MATIAFSTLKTNVKARVFPFGTADNLDTVVNGLIVEALIYIQRYVPCYQSRNYTTVTNTSGTCTACGMTMIQRPQGEIVRLRNELTDDSCDFFVYSQVTRRELEEKADEWADVDLSDCRLGYGLYAFRKGNIAVTPILRDEEKIIIEWRGIKRSYASSDAVFDNPELFAAICAYVEKEVARKFDIDTEKWKLAEDSFSNLVAEMAYDCREHGIADDDDIVCDDGSVDDDDDGGGDGGGDDDDGGGDGGGGDTSGTLAPVVITPADGAEVILFPVYAILYHPTDGVEIRYTLDGTTPNASSQLYSSPVPVGDGITIKAYATKSGYQDSVVSSATYVASLLSIDFTFDGSIGDYVGQWSQWTPNGSTDFRWTLTFNMATQKVVKKIEIYQTNSDGVWDSGQSWSTQTPIYPASRTRWPNITPGEADHAAGDAWATYALLAIDTATNLPMNAAHGEPLGEIPAGNQVFYLYGQPFVSAADYHRIFVEFDDGTVVTAMVPVQTVDFAFNGESGDYVGYDEAVSPTWAADGRWDWKWVIGFTLDEPKELKQVELYQTGVDPWNWDSGQSWATQSPIYPASRMTWAGHSEADDFGPFALAVFGGGVQLNTAFGASVGTFTSGAHELTLRGQPFIAPSPPNLPGNYFRVFLIWADNSVSTAVVEMIPT